MRRIAALLLVALLAAACQPADTELPTLFVLPSLTPIPTASATPAPTDTDIPTETSLPTDTPIPTVTDTATAMPTETFTPSNTPTPSQTPIASATINPTSAVLGSATAQVLEAPVFSTFTPLPPGVIAAVRRTSTGTPQIVADVVITQAQFQEEVDRILAGNALVNSIELFIEDDGIAIDLTAPGEEAFVSGRFVVRFELSVGAGGFDNLVIVRPVAPDEFVMLDGSEAPEAFLEVAYGDVTEAIFQAFDDILNQRLGQGQHDLEFMTLADGQMYISLLVPEN